MLNCKQEIFVGPEICDLIHDTAFRVKMNPLELAALNAFVLVVPNFLENKRAKNYNS